MLCPSCGTNVGSEARLCRSCNAGGPERARRSTSGGGAGDGGLANAFSSSIVGVLFVLGVLSVGFGYALRYTFEKISLTDGLLIALTTSLLVAAVMGCSFIDCSKIAAPARLVRLLIAVTLVYCAVNLYQRPIIEFALAKTRTSIETSKSVKDFERKNEWLLTVKDDLKETTQKITGKE